MADDIKDPFENGASGYGKKAAEVDGRLVILYPKEYREGIKTKFVKPGEAGKDAVEGTIVVLDEKDPTGSEEDDFSFMNGRLVGSLKRRLGKMILGRIGTVPTDKGNDAYVLNDPTEDDKKVARAYLAAKDPFDS